MTGIEKIKTKILDDASARASQIKEQADREARDIMEQASKEAENKKAELLKKAQSDSEESYRRLLAVAELEGRKEILRAKQDMIEKAFRTAMGRITGMPDREYQKLLEEMIVDAAAAKGSGEILLSEKDAKRMDSSFISNINQRLSISGKGGILTVSNENIQTAGGFILRSGDMEVNDTFEILFGMLRPELENEVVGILF